MLEIGRYRIADPDEIATPALVLFEDRVDHNIRTVCELAGGAENLFTHAKTHKSDAVTRKQIAQGIENFKLATLSELQMVLRAGARRAILANPQTQPGKIEMLIDLAMEFPRAWIATIASSPAHVGMLGDAAARREQPLRVMLDLDSGMHRTGIAMNDDAVGLYRQVDEHSFLETAGLHWYDGHDTFVDPIQRSAVASGHIEALQAFRERLEAAGLTVPVIVAGGAYSFSYYANTDGMYGSPGSFIYWDGLCMTDLADLPFQNAAVILVQVVDRHPDLGTITTDLGNKYVCTHQELGKRAHLVDHDDAELVLHNEEYGVFRMAGELPEIGAYLLAIPGYIGPTVTRYPGSHVIDPAGNVVDYYEHTARDRA
jgi:D-serine deaminase-like pyridoxal phosphate-dependent protein